MMNCKEGAKIYCKNSWENGGYTSEQHCLEFIGDHACDSEQEKASIKDRLLMAIQSPYAWVAALALGLTVTLLVRWKRKKVTA